MHSLVEIALINGYVFYANGAACNGPIVSITNLNTGKTWEAETNATSNYYRLNLTSCVDVNASEVLRFDASSPDRTRTNTTEYTVTQADIDAGGLFNFNITLGMLPRIGDMNGDGEVDFDDVIALAKHVYFGDPVYDDPDVNGDGEVDFDDVILLAKHIYFGDPIYP